MNALAQLIFSLGFGLVYTEMATGLAVSDNAWFYGALAFAAYLAAFYAPQMLFHYSFTDGPATVLTQLSRRFGIAAAITLLLNAVIAYVWLPGHSEPVPIAMEIYSSTIMGIVIFHAMCGLMAEQANFLQRTGQYRSDQLLAVTVVMCILFLLLAMYFLAFDLGAARAPRIYVRDMLFGTLAVFGFAWFLYRLAHH